MRPTHSQHDHIDHSETNSLPADRIIRPFFHPPPSFLRSVSSYTFFSLGLFFLSTDPLLLCSMLRSHSLRSQSQRDQLAPSTLTHKTMLSWFLLSHQDFTVVVSLISIQNLLPPLRVVLFNSSSRDSFLLSHDPFCFAAYCIHECDIPIFKSDSSILLFV